ncbi:hypothetical protein ACFVZ8_27780 [Streptomyces sp. NPDC059558]|uniref:hypothetical protein n=1 Tax=Streptomyces sp. NPDC059558 TaxID=3346864 RepID=UPI0036A3F68F
MRGLLRSRLLMALAGAVVLGFTVLWTVRQGQAAGSLTVGGTTSPLGDGLAHAYGAGALTLLGAAIMRGRPLPPHSTTTPPEAYPPAERP